MLQNWSRTLPLASLLFLGIGCSSVLGLDEFKPASTASAGAGGAGAAGGSGGSAGLGGSSAGGVGGSSVDGGSGAVGGTAGTTGGTGGSAGSGHTCTLGPVATLGDAARKDGPEVHVARCTNIGYVVLEDPSGLEIYATTYSTDALGTIGNYKYQPGNFPSVGAATCTTDELRLLVRDANGVAELVFPRTGNDLNTPLAPTRIDIDTSACTNVHNIIGSYSGTSPHYALECLEGSQYDLYYGPPFTKFASVSTGSADTPHFYAYSGGIHLILTEDGKAWRGADASQLATLRQFNLEDPVNRPVALMVADSNSQGFTLTGMTRAKAPDLLPGRIFTGTVAPSEIDGMFVGGTLPSSVEQRGEITSADEVGPISRLSSGKLSSAFTVLNQSNQVRLTTMDSDGALLVSNFLIQDARTDAAATEALVSSGDDGSSFRVIWIDIDQANQYAVRTRGAFCL